MKNLKFKMTGMPSSYQCEDQNLPYEYTADSHSNSAHLYIFVKMACLREYMVEVLYPGESTWTPFTNRMMYFKMANKYLDTKLRFVSDKSRAIHYDVMRDDNRTFTHEYVYNSEGTMELFYLFDDREILVPANYVSFNDQAKYIFDNHTEFEMAFRLRKSVKLGPGIEVSGTLVEKMNDLMTRNRNTKFEIGIYQKHKIEIPPGLKRRGTREKASPHDYVFYKNGVYDKYHRVSVENKYGVEGAYEDFLREHNL